MKPPLRFKRTGKRNEIFLATKFGYSAGGVIRGEYEYVKQALGRSLERLGIDTIDLYYIHRYVWS
jgi:aryl-alcohol dehydrogenase-like predicted oxidoreductase